jgi:RNA polymerase sigma-70 factor (ECF subfamily)
MGALHDKAPNAPTAALPADGVTPHRHGIANYTDRPRRTPAQNASRFKNWKRRSEKWGCLMVAAQGGERQAYEQLFRELDAWLRRYYARRLPYAAADDARQDALLAIHAKRQTYMASKPFGPWVAAIARYKWIDYVREASRSTALLLHEERPIEDYAESATSAIAVDDLLKRLKPAQARVIRLVKLDGASIEDASSATGQSVPLVKVNIHRGLKKLAALAAGGGAMSVGVQVAKNICASPAKD